MTRVAFSVCLLFGSFFPRCGGVASGEAVLLFVSTCEARLCRASQKSGGKRK